MLRQTCTSPNSHRRSQASNYRARSIFVPRTLAWTKCRTRENTFPKQVPCFRMLSRPPRVRVPGRWKDSPEMIRSSIMAREPTLPPLPFRQPRVHSRIQRWAVQVEMALCVLALSFTHTVRSVRQTTTLVAIAFLHDFHRACSWLFEIILVFRPGPEL
jgi:hypothetical protein